MDGIGVSVGRATRGRGGTSRSRVARALALRASQTRRRGRTASFLTGPDMATDARHGLTPGRETNVFLYGNQSTGVVSEARLAPFCGLG